MWFGERNLRDVWRFESSRQLYDNSCELSYSYQHRGTVDCPDDAAVVAFHGTKAYNVWRISLDGLAPSFDSTQGHDFHGRPGVFVSLDRTVALDDAYSTSQNVFGQGAYYKMPFSVVIDRRKVSYKGKGNWEWVLPPDAVWLLGLHIIANPKLHDHRLQGYEPWLESVPEGQQPIESSVVGKGLFDEWY